MNDKMRKEFEVAYEAKKMLVEADLFQREIDDSEEYKHPGTAAAWWGWKTSRASRPAPVVTEGWRARVNRRREKAEAQRSILLACIADIRERSRETPAWATAYSSAITAIEIRIANIKE